MSRPADNRWEALGESGDPVPGDVHDLQALARRFEATAKTITETTEALRRLGNLESWDSEAGKAFAEKAGDTAKTVGKAHDRYADAASALKTYYTDLETIQEDADKLLRDAETKSGDLTTARSGADNPPKGTTDGDQKKLDKKVTDIQDGLADLRGQLAAVKTRHKEAGDKAAKAIHDTTEGDGLNDGWLDDLRDSLKIISEISGAIAAVCGVAALLVGWIPVIGQALAGVLGTIALVMTVVSLVCHVLLAINGDGSWGDVAIDVLGLATFGIGRVFTSGAKLAATVGRSRVWQAATQYVRGWNPGMASNARRALVESMVGPRAGAVDDVALPDVSLAAAFRGLPRSFADDFSAARSNFAHLFRASDNMAALRNAYNTAGVRGVASMYGGPGLVDELGRMKNIDAADLAIIGTPDAFKQAIAYNTVGLGGTGVGAGSDLNSLFGLFTGDPEIDVTGSDASLAGEVIREMTSTTENDWRQCRVALPAPQNWLVLDLRSEDPETWAREVAKEHLAEGAPVELRDAFATDVLWYWAVAVRQRALCAALLAPPESAVIASYAVRELRIPQESLSVAAFRAEAARAEGPYFGGQRLTEVELSLGPALRVHRLEPTAPDADSGTIVEGVVHYVLPRAHATALECRLLWSTLGFGEELEKMADELVESVLLE